MSKLFFSGVPTEMDVRKLREAYPALRTGDEIEHEQVASVIGVDPKANRYRTVVEAWRKGLLREGIDLGAVMGSGFRVLSDTERVDYGLKGFQSGVRKQIRSVQRATRVNTNDPNLQKKQEHMQRYSAVIVREAQSMMRDIAPPKPVQQITNMRRPGKALAG